MPSRSGPMVPVVLAAASTWQLPQFERKIVFPFVASPLRWKAGTTGKVVVGVVVLSVLALFGVGEATPSELQPASTTAPSSRAAMTPGRRTAPDSNEALRPPCAGTGRTCPLSTIRDMKRRNFGRDRGLSLRMLFTSGLLGLLYVGFAVVLFSVLNVGLAPLLVIVIGLAFFQYYTSDKLALAASGAKIVSPEEAPDLHAMVERLCAMADRPKPRVAVVDTDAPNAFAPGRNPQ